MSSSSKVNVELYSASSQTASNKLPFHVFQR